MLQIQERQEIFRRFLESAGQGMAMADLNGRVIFINASFCRTLGVEAPEVVYGQALFHFHTAESAKRLREEILPRVLQEGQWVGEIAFIDTLARIIPAIQNIFLIRDDDGQPLCFATVVTVMSGPAAVPEEGDSEAQRAQRALRDEALLPLRFRGLMENARDMIYRMSLPDGRYEYVSPASRTILGYEPDEFYKNPILIKKLIHPDWLDYFMREWEALNKGRMSNFYEYKVIHKSGEERWLYQRNVLAKDETGQPVAIEGVVTDITERKQAEEGLVRERDFSRAAFDSMPGLIYLFDADGRFIRWNKSISMLTGYTDEEIARMSVLDFFGPSEKDRVQKALEEIFAGGKTQLQASLIAKDGTITPYLLGGSLLIYDGKPCVIGLALDISDRKRLEEQLLQAQKMEAVGQLAGGVAHDFNNLLQAILGYLELVMISVKPTDRNYSLLNEVKRAGERAATLTRQLLAFSRRQVLQLANLDLNQVVAELMRMLQRLIGEDIELMFIPCKSASSLRADRSQIEQVLMNLCVNARDAMPGGGRLTLEITNIVANEAFVGGHEWAQPGRYLCISVTDTGCGMDKETLQQIFEPFFTTKEKHKGTGLGLAMVYGIIRQHRGMVQVYSEIDQGTCFKIYLPAEITARDEEHQQPELAPAAGGTETILLAEDEAMIRNLACRILREAGYRVFSADDGQAALALYQAHAGEITLLFLDVVMPRMGGRAVYDAAKAINPEVKCIFASGYSSDGLHTDYILEEGLHLLQKPYNRGALLRLIREVLDEPL